jgi:hypothetical protein
MVGRDRPYIDSASASGNVAASREITINRFNPTVSVNLNLNLTATATSPASLFLKRTTTRPLTIEIFSMGVSQATSRVFG